MAYGRLDIYWPDGRVESVLLNEPTVSIGRAEGNTISLDTETISRYHFSLIYDDEADTVSVTDLESANGTYVDGSPLESNTPRVLGDVEELQAGALRIIFRKLDDSPTLAVHPLEEDTQRIERDEANYRLELDHRHINVWPAASSSVELAVINLANETRHFSVRVGGMPGEWLRVNRPELELASHMTGYVLIHIKPPRRATTTPTAYQVTIEVEPEDRPEMMMTATLNVDVRGYSGFGMALVPQPAPGDPVTVFLHNQGSQVLTISLKATDPQKALTFKLPQHPLNLQAGQRMRVDIQVDAAQPRLVGSPVDYPFVVQARAQNAAGFIAATSGKVAIAPRMPVWGAVSIGGIMLSIVAIALVALLGLLNPPEPEIENLRAMPQRIARGDLLELAFTPRDTRSIDITVNDQLVAQGLPGDTASYEIQTDAYDGIITIDVIAHNGRVSNEATTTAQVYQPMQVEMFTIRPSPLVRNVVTDITIVWDVPGAAEVRFTGLSDFMRGLPPPTSDQASGTLENISGLPTEPLTITLYAEDEAGNALEESRTVSMVDPICTSTREINLYDGPGENYQQLSTVQAGVSLVVEARDGGNGWLRVQVPSIDPALWGARDAFQCNDNFDLQNLVVEPAAPPTPTPAPLEATPTAIPTTTAPPATPGSQPTVNPTNVS